MRIRHAAVAGQFYPDDPATLRGILSRMISRSEEPVRVIGLVAPHAGYIYSGGVAGKGYGFIQIPRTVIILCPNHHGIGAPVAVSAADAWETPLGVVPLDAGLADRVVSHPSGVVVRDDLPHLREHSLEVHLPFLQFLRPDVEIVPISLGFGDTGRVGSLATILAEVVSASTEPVLIVASSDMTHYESADAARVKDQLAIDRFRALDPEGLVSVCRRHRITMCGVIPAAVMLKTAILLGARRADLIAYSTSGDVTGDYRQVVAYAALTVR